jgi:hypothetical protein
MKWHHLQQCRWKEGILPPLVQWRIKHLFTRVYAWSQHCNWNHLQQANDAHGYMSQDLWTYTGHIQWMLYISSPEKLSHLIFGIATLSHTTINDFQEALPTCIIWNRAFNRHRNRKYFETTLAATHTNTPTVWLSSMNIQYSGVTECMGFHVSKVHFSSSNFLQKYFPF